MAYNIIQKVIAFFLLLYFTKPDPQDDDQRFLSCISLFFYYKFYLDTGFYPLQTYSHVLGGGFILLLAVVVSGKYILVWKPKAFFVILYSGLFSIAFLVSGA